MTKNKGGIKMSGHSKWQNIEPPKSVIPMLL